MVAGPEGGRNEPQVPGRFALGHAVSRFATPLSASSLLLKQRLAAFRLACNEAYASATGMSKQIAGEREWDIIILFFYSNIYLLISAICSWHGEKLPKVRFLNGREEIIFPENFKASVANTGTCIRVQVSSLGT